MADDSNPTYSPDHFPSPPEDDPVEIAKKLGKVNVEAPLSKDYCVLCNWHFTLHTKI